MRKALRIALAIFFVVAGAMHFLRPAFYLQIMPPFLPWPLLLVYLSGALEILGGLGVVPPRTRPWAGIGLVALLLSVFPANIQMTLHPVPIGGWEIPIWMLWLRLPLQGVLLAWVWWATGSPARVEA